MVGGMEVALKGAGVVPPRWATVLVERGSTTLAVLLGAGLAVRARGGRERTVVRFARLRGPAKAQEGTGWLAVKVRSNFGGVSDLLYDAETGGVSGILRLQK